MQLRGRAKNGKKPGPPVHDDLCAVVDADGRTSPAIGLVKHPRPVQGAPVPARPGPVTPEVGEAEPSSAAMQIGRASCRERV